MNTATIKLIVAAILLVAAASGGWVARGWKADSDQLEAVNAEAKKYAANVEALADGIQKISIVREQERQQTDLDHADFQRRLKHAKRTREPMVECQPPNAVAPVAVDGDAVRFSPGFIRLWNEALDVGLPAALRAGGTESADTGADLPAVEDILDNLEENAKACNALRARARTCKAYIEELEALP